MTSATRPPRQSAAEDAVPACPYVGLVPFHEHDAAFFFGRENEIELIAANLVAARLTLLYAPSGVGKTSVLRAGVVPRLHLIGEEDDDLGLRRAAVAYVRDWSGPPRETVAAELCRALRATGASVDGPAPAEPLVTWLRGLPERASIPVAYLILDQFEEYFLYHTPGTGAGGFDAEFARAVNQQDDGVNFMISMREEDLSKLDRFRVRIPNLLTNLLRLENLDREAATEAITRPLEVYNEEHPEARKAIEPALVEAILRQVAPEDRPEGAGGQQASAERPDGQAGVRIETPFLQVVLTRLWEEERRKGSDTLRLATLDALGGAKNIARTHLDEVMSKLDERERDAAAAVLRFLVTPAGAKIAQQPTALAAWSELTPEAVRRVLTHLSSRQEMCILRKVTVPGQEERYELFHDVLGPAILNWHSRYTADERLRKERKRFNRLAVGMAALVLLLIGMGALTAYALKQKAEAETRKAEAEKLKAEAERRKNEAEGQRELVKRALAQVETERDRANEQKAVAEEAKKKAEASKLEADRQAALAKSREEDAVAARRRVEVEALRGVALTNLIEGDADKAVENFRELNRRSAGRADSEAAGRGAFKLADVLVKIADLKKDNSLVGAFQDFAVETSDLSEPTEGGEGSFKERAQELSRQNRQSSELKAVLDLAEAGKEGFDTLRPLVGEAEGAFKLYQEALTFNRGGQDPDRFKREARIERGLGDTHLGLAILKVLADAAAQPGKQATDEEEGAIFGSLLKTIDFYDRALYAYHSADLPLEEARLSRRAGAMLFEMSKEKMARVAGPAVAEQLKQRIPAYYERSAHAYRRAGRPRAAALMYKNTADLYADGAGDDPRLREAIKHYEQARQIYEDVGEYEREGAVSLRLAEAHLKLGGRSRALGYFEQARRAYRRAASGAAPGDSASSADQAFREAVSLLAESEGDEALRKYLEEVLGDPANADPEARARLLTFVAEHYEWKKNKREAAGYYGRVREVWRKAGKPLQEAAALKKVGTLMDEAGAADQAARAFEEARSLYAALVSAPAPPDADTSSTVVNQLLDIARYYAKYDPGKAAAVYEQALRANLASATKYGYVTTNIIDEAGNLLLRLKTPEAEQRFLAMSKEAADFYRVAGARPGAAASGTRAEAPVLNTTGEVYSRIGRKEEAVKFFERAFDVYLGDKDFESALTQLGKIGELKAAGEDPVNSALGYFNPLVEAARAAGDHVREGVALEVLGNFHRDRRNYEQALDSYRRARTAYQAAGLRDREVRAITNMANQYQAMGKRDEAERLFKEARELPPAPPPPTNPAPAPTP